MRGVRCEDAGRIKAAQDLQAMRRGVGGHTCGLVELRKRRAEQAIVVCPVQQKQKIPSVGAERRMPLQLVEDMQLPLLLVGVQAAGGLVGKRLRSGGGACPPAAFPLERGVLCEFLLQEFLQLLDGQLEHFQRLQLLLGQDHVLRLLLNRVVCKDVHLVLPLCLRSVR